MFRFISDLNTREFTGDERAVLIANHKVIENFLEKLMTVMINSEVQTTEDIQMCRAMKNRGVEMLEAFKELNDKKSAIKEQE